MRKCQLPRVVSDTNSFRYDMYKDIDEKLATKRGQPYEDKFVCGLPIGLELPNGITIGESTEK